MPSKPTFERAIEPMIDALTSLVDTYLALHSAHGGGPDAHSPAMAELAAEAPPIRNDAWTQPVQTAQSVAAMLGFSAVDHLDAYVSLFRGRRTPVYSFTTLARATIETFGRQAWLCEEGIGWQTRVQRSVALDLRSLVELRQIPSVKAWANDRIDCLKKGARQAGWIALPNRTRGPEVGGVAVPSMGRSIGNVLGLSDAVSAAPDGTRQALAWLLSGTSHGDPLALMQRMDKGRPVTDLGSTMKVAVVTDSREVMVIGASLALACVTGAGRMGRLMGWRSTGWDQAVRQAARFVHAQGLPATKEESDRLQ